MKKLVIEKGTVKTMNEPNSQLYYDKKENRAWARSFYNRDDSTFYHDENIIAITFLPDDLFGERKKLWTRELIEKSILFDTNYRETFK